MIPIPGALAAYAHRGGPWEAEPPYAEAAAALAALYREITDIDRELATLDEDGEPTAEVADSPDAERAVVLWERRETLLTNLIPAIARAHRAARQLVVPLNLFGKLCDAPDCRDILYPGQPMIRLATPGYMILDFHPLCAVNLTRTQEAELLADGGIRR